MWVCFAGPYPLLPLQNALKCVSACDKGGIAIEVKNGALCPVLPPVIQPVQGFWEAPGSQEELSTILGELQVLNTCERRSCTGLKCRLLP